MAGTAVKNIDQIKAGDLVEIVTTRESNSIDEAVVSNEPRPLSYFAFESNEGYESGNSDLSSDDSCCDPVKQKHKALKKERREKKESNFQLKGHLCS